MDLLRLTVSFETWEFVLNGTDINQKNEEVEVELSNHNRWGTTKWFSAI